MFASAPKTKPHLFARLAQTASLLGLLAVTLTGFATPGQAQSVASLHLTMGNPSNAVTSTSYWANYLMQKPQFALSYHRDKGIPNWVSWHLGYQDLGSAPRSSSFYSDTTLPSGWFQVTSSTYTGSGYDRGHNCPSADRTATSTDNKATFLMTNIMPQAADNNQGPWAMLEDYCRDLVLAGNELYIISGGDGSLGTISSGRVSIPAYTWKVILVQPEGTNDVARVTTATRVIAVDMQNQQGIRYTPWRNFRVTVDQIEGWTGYNFLSNVPDSIENVIESRLDTQ